MVAQDVVDQVLPTILAEFDETVVIQTMTLINTQTGADIGIGVTSENNKTYRFTPSKALQNGPYTLSISAADLLGNTAVFIYNFNVNVAETEIVLLKPRIGVSNTSAFDLVIATPNRESDCRYRSTIITDYGQPGLQSFATEDHFTHTAAGFEMQEEFPRDLFVVCLDSLGRENYAQYKLYVDLTPPTLSSVNWDPAPIVEYPLVGDIISKMEPQSSEEVICRYTNSSDDTYEDMTPYELFDLQDFDAYEQAPAQEISFPDDPLKKDYPFYVQCEDRAGWKTAKTSTSVLLDLTAALAVRVYTPLPASRETYVFINVSTNKLAYCNYKFPDTEFTPMSSSPTDLRRHHTVDIGEKGSGSYTVTFYCFSDISGAPEEIIKDYSFIIDLDPPGPTTINVTTPICSSTAEATFSATDALSGIGEFSWTFFTPTDILNNGSSDGTVSVGTTFSGDSIRFNESTSYFFMAHAIDKAGNIGSQSQSGEMKYDATGKTCDKTPPIVTLMKNAAGDAVEMLCQDEQTGCLTYSWAYSRDSSCNSTFNYVFPPVLIPLPFTTYICYEVADGAGNIARGSQLFDLNLSTTVEGLATCDEGIDNDGDGRGWGCSNGYDCDDTDAEQYIDCTSGCTQDTDGDGYGFGCVLGNDCNDNSANETKLCANGCISDNDGDGHGLGCDDGADCDGLNPVVQVECTNGCFDDNDGDGYGFGCMAGIDCNGENHDARTICVNGCISDMDGDGFGQGCADGLDCDGTDPNIAVGCTSNCVDDEDSDGFGLGCDDGLDCNGFNPEQTVDCPNGCVVDSDGDGKGPGCADGLDCNDLDATKAAACESGCKLDTDGDGYGLCCTLGPDCSDYDRSQLDGCTSNCTFDSDCDQMHDTWEARYNLSVGTDDGAGNPDGDDYSNLEEYCSDRDPNSKDEVYKPPEPEKPNPDKDGDGIVDTCEDSHPLALSSDDPYDADKDFDGDGLTNKFECGYSGDSCYSGLDPQGEDTDGDGVIDGVEIDAGTDPCDPSSKPGSPVGLIFVILGFLQVIAAVNYWIYRFYYVPRTKPKPVPQPTRPQRAVPRPVRPMVHRSIHRRPVHKRLTERLSREKYLEEQRMRAAERTKMLDVFGKRRKTEARKVMEKIAKKPEEKIVVPKKVKELKAVKKPEGEDSVEKLAKLIEGDNFDRLAKMSKGEADHFEKLARIIRSRQDRKLGSDQVSKLATITKKIGGDDERIEGVRKAIKKTDVD
ncbi:MAG: hypothetical protein ACE5DM_02755, partial [Candidatus Nanoarchaeia archaeon]